MNLYKIQEELKFKSIPELQHFANGMDPKVPAWMASAVLKAKVDEKQRWDNMQGAAQGQMPSVKEQLEQKAGLMQQQASQAPAGLAQAAMPAPKGPVQMPGGITSGNAGANMDFAEGGIVGFSDGGKGDKYETPYDRKRREEQEEGTAGLGNMLLYGSAPVAAAADVAALPISLIRNMFYSGKGDAPGWTPVMDARQRALEGKRVDALAAAPQEERPAPTEQDVLEVMQRQDGAAPAVVKRPPAPQGIASGATKVPPTGAPAPAGAPAPTGAPRVAPAGGLGSSSVAGMLQKQLGKETAQPTTEDAIAAIKGIQKGFGVDKPAGEEERAMIAQMRAQREGQVKDRGLQNLITYLTNVRGSTIGEGLGRGAQMSQAEIARQNAADLAHQEKMYELVSGLNKANRAEGVGAAKSAGELLAGREKTTSENERAKLQALANVYHTDVAAGAQLQSAQIMAAARESGLDSKDIQMAESAYSRDPEAQSIKEQMKNPIIANNPAKMEAAIKRLREIQISKYAQFGLKIEGTTPSANAGGTPPPGAVRLKQ